jgi:signal transduction histidine kinase
MNLCENAVLYSVEGGRVSIWATLKDNDSLLVHIRNGTRLVLTTDQSLLFSKFYRGEDAEYYHPSGMGLGLFFCYRICKKVIHGNINFS